MDQLNELQSFIDEHKGELSDEIYKKICEYNLRTFNREQNCFYRVNYDILKMNRNFRDNVRLVKERKTTIIRMPEYTFTKFLSLICQDIDTEKHPEMDIIYQQLDIPSIDLTIEGDVIVQNEDDDEEDEMTEYHRRINISNCCFINSIVKL